MFEKLMRAVVRALPIRIETKSRWDAAARPHYLQGVLYAALQAQREDHAAITVAEFGVASGSGLRILEAHARGVARATGVRVDVYGFDTGFGLTNGTGDYRDHVDQWRPGDYPMDVARLRASLASTTRLVLGDVAETVASMSFEAPLGFLAMDLDFYSSTRDALYVLARSDVPRLRRVALYFDDVEFDWCHEWAGELLAISEFNDASASLKIAPWRGLSDYRPFPSAPWLKRMYLAHDLAAISRVRLERAPVRLAAAGH